MEKVSWEDTTAFCKELTKREAFAERLPEGYEYALPTEAQWEYAARAGTTTRFSYGDDPGYSELGNHAWYMENSRGGTHPVGEKLPNPWGLYDMHGNVWEWCSDWSTGSYPGGSVTDPVGPGSGSDRVLRGGGWYFSARYCRSAHRDGDRPGYTSGYLGFRVALVPVR